MRSLIALSFVAALAFAADAGPVSGGGGGGTPSAGGSHSSGGSGAASGAASKLGGGAGKSTQCVARGANGVSSALYQHCIRQGDPKKMRSGSICWAFPIVFYVACGRKQPVEIRSCGEASAGM